jgi:hypothetical protein
MNWGIFDVRFGGATGQVAVVERVVLDLRAARLAWRECLVG